MKRILFVCTGNICRSPTAEGVARHFIQMAGLSDCVEVDSAGTHGYHVGEAPDPRTRQSAAQRGYELDALVARRIEPVDFQRFDLLLAMDRSHYEAMLKMCAPVYRHKVRLFMSYAPNPAFDEVPDPYYGGKAGFEAVLDMCEEAVHGLLESLAPVRR
jgi:protein-tyrosine phosphatase